MVLSFIKQPHCLQRARRLSNHSHLLQTANRDSINSLSDRGLFGSNRSKKVTSLIGYIITHGEVCQYLRLLVPGIFRILAHRARDVGGCRVSLYTAELI